MPQILKTSLLILVVTLTSPALGASDFMAKKSVSINSSNSKEIFRAIISDLKGIMENVTPKTDPGSKIIVPYKVKGSQARPIATMTIRKCVLVICKTVAFDTEFVADEVKGKCQTNYLITGDFRRSSAVLTDIYEKMTLNLCFNTAGSGSGTISVDAYLVRAPNYSADLIQGQIFSYLKLQVGPMVRAVEKSIQEEIARRN